MLPDAAVTRSFVMRLIPFACLALAACSGGPAPDPIAPAPRFDAIAFFSGESRGAAMLKVVFKTPQPVRVESRGRVGPDGVLVLDQTIREGEKPARERQWRIREVAPGRYAGTLSDAIGPVSGESEGNRLHLAFRMKGGLDVQQWLSLAADGRSAHNVMVVRKFGLAIAHLEETIRKLP